MIRKSSLPKECLERMNVTLGHKVFKEKDLLKCGFTVNDVFLLVKTGTIKEVGFDQYVIIKPRNKEEEIIRFVNWGCDALISDVPDYCLKVLEGIK